MHFLNRSRQDYLGVVFVIAVLVCIVSLAAGDLPIVALIAGIVGIVTFIVSVDRLALMATLLGFIALRFLVAFLVSGEVLAVWRWPCSAASHIFCCELVQRAKHGSSQSVAPLRDKPILDNAKDQTRTTVVCASPFFWSSPFSWATCC